MQKKYGDRVAFYIIYIREAHPTDGWQSKGNEQDGVLFKQPTTLLARSDIALEMCVLLQVSLPCLLDGLDNKVGTAYSGLPDRLYVVDRDGRILYKGDRGPRGFQPDEMAAALDKSLPTVAKRPGQSAAE